MAAGALAGSATVLITNPIWVVNTRMTFLKIIREDGPGRLFAGVLPALVLVINPILQYTIFEQLKQVLEKRRKVTATDSFLLGALGKLAATSITYPYITVKSRAHVATGEGREGMTASLKRIVREEGVAGLYGGKSCLSFYIQRWKLTISQTGIAPKVTQSVLTAAFLFAFKDILYAYTIKARRRIAQKI
jgi:adenine nucleotide transporter 17